MVSYGCEMDHKGRIQMRAFENKLMKRIFGPAERKQQGLGELHEEDLHNLWVYSLPSTAEHFEEAVKRDMNSMSGED
jgi:hypothetical protein